MRILLAATFLALWAWLLTIDPSNADPPKPPGPQRVCLKHPQRLDRCEQVQPDAAQPLALATPAAAPSPWDQPQQAPFQRVKIIIIVPRDFNLYSYDPGWLVWLVSDWTWQTRQWYLQQTGVTFEYEGLPQYPGWAHLHYTDRTLRQLQTFDGVYHGDSCGEGISLNAVIGELYRWGLDTQYERTWTMVLGGGGWAGGFTQNDHNNIAHRGMLFGGDWGARAFFGQPQTPCNPGYFSSGPGMWGHESTHTMGIDSHNPCCLFPPPHDLAGCCVNWTNAHRNQLWHWNVWVPNFVRWP